MIPRIIHQVWLGGRPPSEVTEWIRTWHERHGGDWECRLWTDENRPTLENELEFDQAPSLAMKADILRYELLRRYGGIYADADFECHASFEPFVSGSRQLFLVSQFGTVCNGLIGCAPGHPLIEAAVRLVPSRMAESTPARWASHPHAITGPHLIDELFCSSRLAFQDPGVLLPGDYFFEPRTRVPQLLRAAERKRYATHHALASWQRDKVAERVRATRLRTRVRRFVDLAHP